MYISSVFGGSPDAYNVCQIDDSKMSTRTSNLRYPSEKFPLATSGFSY